MRFVLTLVFLTTGTQARAQTGSDDLDQVTLARASGAAIAIWDATSTIADIVRTKSGNSAINDRLERDALEVALETTGDLDPKATSLTVRVVYQKVGSVSPLYGNDTFGGIVRYAEVTFPAARLRAAGASSVHNAARLPAWINYRVVGRLPA